MGVRPDRIMAYTDSNWAANREDRHAEDASVSDSIVLYGGAQLARKDCP